VFQSTNPESTASGRIETRLTRRTASKLWALLVIVGVSEVFCGYFFTDNRRYYDSTSSSHKMWKKCTCMMYWCTCMIFFYWHKFINLCITVPMHYSTRYAVYRMYMTYIHNFFL
jgi:hypothetical protein